MLALALPFSAATAKHVDDATSLLHADADFVHAFQKKDANAAARLLSPDFTWIDSAGRRLTRAQALATFPVVNNAELISEEHIFGASGLVRANHGKVNVLRVWRKNGDVWRILLYQEVMQGEKPETVNSEAPVECVNPCKEIPYQPQTPSEKEAIVSLQGVMNAMAENDADACAPLIADEFTATDTFHDRPSTKADRLAQILKQRESGKRHAPPELISAEMFDLGETVLMIGHEQLRGAKAYLNSRMWVKRDERWQMLFSFNTRIE